MPSYASFRAAIRLCTDSEAVGRSSFSSLHLDVRNLMQAVESKMVPPCSARCSLSVVRCVFERSDANACVFFFLFFLSVGLAATDRKTRFFRLSFGVYQSAL